MQRNSQSPESKEDSDLMLRIAQKGEEITDEDKIQFKAALDRLSSRNEERPLAPGSSITTRDLCESLALIQTAEEVSGKSLSIEHRSRLVATLTSQGANKYALLQSMTAFGKLFANTGPKFDQ